MATQILRPKAVSTERIRRRLRPAKHAPPNKEALALIQGVVRRSKSVEDAVTAVRAVNSAWAKVSSATHDATELLVTILDLSDNVEEALATHAMLRNDGSLLEPLTAIQQFVKIEFPNARLRIIPGDDVSSSYLYVLIPTTDYPSFWAAHVRLRDWSIEHFPKLGQMIQIVSRPVSADV